MTSSKEDTLYRRLGGRDAIVRVVNHWFEQMKHDPDFRLFHGLSASTEKESTQATIAYLSAASGGGGHYSQRQQRVAHQAIVLMSNLWETSAGYLMEALASEGVSDMVKGEVISCMTGLREEFAETASTAKGQSTYG